MPQVMNAIDCLVHPQIGTEALGLVVCEAHACGKPVIASALDGIPEAFAPGNCGKLVPPEDVPALAGAGRQSSQKAGSEPNNIMNIIIRKSSFKKSYRKGIWTTAVAVWTVATAATHLYAQPAGDTWQNLQEIVKFSQAHMSDDVIITYIKTSGKTYPTGADALLYLNSQGVSQPVLAALMGAPAPAAAPAPPAVITAPPETPTIDYFQAHLTPYGQWIDVPGVGAAWVPAEANNPLWRPYMDAGHWQFSDAGWFWQSDYPWGDMAFHYGRWIHNEFTGGRWAWAPGYNWAPSWVSWREGAGGMGWAPLPWGVEFHVGVGLYWHGAAVVEGVDFGLGFDSFVFVGADHFWGGNYNVYVFDRERSRTFYEHSTFHAGYRMEGGHLMAEGLGREHMAAITHHEVEVHKATELRHTEETHNFAKRTEEHKDLARVVVHSKEPGHAEANHGAAPNHGAEAREHATPEHGAVTHAPEAHPGAPAKDKEAATHPGTASEHGAPATHTPEAHPGAPGSTHPGTTGPNAKPPATAAKPAAPKPKPGEPGTSPPK
jgi:hypothetical protein